MRAIDGVEVIILDQWSDVLSFEILAAALPVIVFACTETTQPARIVVGEYG